MFKRKMRRLALLMAIVLCAQLAYPSPVYSAAERDTPTKALNFVFLHGAASTGCALQLLADTIAERLTPHIRAYERANPNIRLQIDTLSRCYPSNVDIDTWANNIADSINNHFANKKNLILIGHSMGGKAALHAVARNTGGLADKVAMVVTINSPIKNLSQYYVTGGASAVDFCRARWLLADQGVCDSVVHYDSSQDGNWVAHNKHWLAFISSESAPLSERFNLAGIDGWPRNMDDGVVPLSAQYSDSADAVYYGEHGHSDLTEQKEVVEFLADTILRYIFGGNIDCFFLARGGTLEHKADWLLGTDHWADVAAEVPVSSGTLQHKNESYTHWQEWEDIVGEYAPKGVRSSYRVNRIRFLPFVSSIEESRWLNPDNPEDNRLYIRTRVAPRGSVQVEWSVYQPGLLPPETERDHYEVQIVSGTPLTGIGRVSWETENPRDLRLRIWSEAQSPFRWFRAQWKVFYKERRYGKVIDEIPAESQ